VIIKNGLAKIRLKLQIRQMDNNLRKFQHSASVLAEYFSVFGLRLRLNLKMQLWSFTAIIVAAAIMEWHSITANTIFLLNLY
jgi:hypothetical protein